MTAFFHGQLYQRWIERAYMKKVWPRKFKEGDLVLKKRNQAISDARGKFAPNYEGPYVVKQAFSEGALILADMDEENLPALVNSDSVVKYYAWCTHQNCGIDKSNEACFLSFFTILVVIFPAYKNTWAEVKVRKDATSSKTSYRGHGENFAKRRRGQYMAKKTKRQKQDHPIPRPLESTSPSWSRALQLHTGRDNEYAQNARSILLV